MNYVIKIKYEESIRRLTWPTSQSTHEELTFARLEGHIRELFQLPANTKLVVTYTDIDDDVITMARDEDLRDALRQQCNPLRLFVTLANSKNGPPNAPNAYHSCIENHSSTPGMVVASISAVSNVGKTAFDIITTLGGW